MTIDFTLNETNYSLPVLREGFALTKRVGELGRHAYSSATLSVRPNDATNALALSKEKVRAYLKEGTNVIMTGIVRPYLSMSYKGAFRDSVKLELLDLTEALHIYVWPAPNEGEPTVAGRIYEQAYYNQPLSSLVQTLFLKGSMIAMVSALQSVTDPQVYFRLEEGTYLDEAIESLLWNYGFDYGFSNDGTPVVFSTFAPETGIGSWNDIRGDVQFSRSDDALDGLIVHYSSVITQNEVKIYSETTINKKFPREGGEPPILFEGQYLSGYYYSNRMHDSAFSGGAALPSSNKTLDWDFSSLSYKGASVPAEDVYVVETSEADVNAYLSMERDVTITPHFREGTITPFGACFWLAYDGDFNENFGRTWGWNINIYGDVTHRIDAEESFFTEGAKDTPMEVSLDHRFSKNGDSSAIKEFARKYYVRQMSGQTKVTFSSLSEPSVGSFYTLGGDYPEFTGISLTVRITSVEKDADGIYNITGECVNAPNIVASIGTAFSPISLGDTPITRDELDTDVEVLPKTVVANTNVRQYTLAQWKGFSNTQTWGNISNAADCVPGDTLLVHGVITDYKNAQMEVQILVTSVSGTDVTGRTIAFVYNVGWKYLGAVTSIPTGAEKTCFLWNGSSTHGTKGLVYYWNGSAWSTWTSINSDNADVLFEILKDAVANNLADSTNASNPFNWFKNLVVENALIKALFAKTITLLDNGVIKSSNYVQNQSGFQIKADGFAEFVGVRMVGGSVTGAGQFDCPSFSSMPKNAGTVRNFSIPSGSSSQVTYITNNVVPLVADGQYYPCTLSIDSNVKFVLGAGSNNLFFTDADFNVRGMIGATVGSTWSGSSFTLVLTIGGGDVFKFKSIPVQSNTNGLENGQVYALQDGTLKIKLT